ncbi:MAG: ABC transporter substrate-binding protein [Bacteroidales bacterium]|nr:ABC transporter substrate-binding protein [Bacteroidales bacterium]
MTKLIPLAIAAAMMLLSCRNEGNSRTGSTDADSPGIPPGRLFIEEVPGAVRVAVREPWQNSGGKELVWYLVARDSPLPQGLNEEQVIQVPVRRMVCMSTTHVAMMRALAADSLIVGISGTSLVYDSLLLDRIRSGAIKDVGYEGNLNRELVISLAPDVVMAYGVADPSSGSNARLADAGVKVFYNADYLEQHPLTRCAWLRLFGLLTGKEEIADSIVSAVTESYLGLAAMAAGADGKRPGVLLGAPWEDVWYVSPGNTYIGRLIGDAGGHYIFSDMTGSNSVPLSVETVFSKASDAEIWINPGTADRLSDITDADHRMASLPLFGGGRIWNNRGRIRPGGGNDYWESGVVRPDLLLKDYISIIHPELLPDHEQHYYIRLE